MALMGRWVVYEMGTKLRFQTWAAYRVRCPTLKSRHQLPWILLKIISVNMGTLSKTVRFSLYPSHWVMYEYEIEMIYEPILLWQTALQQACSPPLSWWEVGCRHSAPPKFCSEGSCCRYPPASRGGSSATGPEKKRLVRGKAGKVSTLRMVAMWILQLYPENNFLKHGQVQRDITWSRGGWDHRWGVSLKV